MLNSKLISLYNVVFLYLGVLRDKTIDEKLIPNNDITELHFLQIRLLVETVGLC